MSVLERSPLAFTVRRPVAITMMVLAFLVFGAVGLMRLPVALLPDISYPTLTIRTRFPGATPQDVEERVSERVQDAVSVIQGVRRVWSVSRPEVSDVVLEFAWGTRMVFAVSDVRERLDRVLLPPATEQPLVLRYDPSLDPVLTVGVFGDQSLVELRRIAEEEIEQELSEIDGVAAVKVRGGDEEEIRIALDEQALATLRIDATRIGQRLRAENLNAAAGAIDEGNTEYLVRALNEFENLEQIEDMVVERRGDVSIRLVDVARVTRVPKEKEVISQVDGKTCVLVDVYKEADANIVSLCEAVRARIFGTARQQAYVAAGRHQEPLPPRQQGAAGGHGGPPGGGERMRKLRERQQNTDYLAFLVEPMGARVELLQDQSRFIEDAVDDVLSSAVVGGLFAILVLYLFLRSMATTAILALSIPVSLIATFAPMFLSGVSLNIMSLGGLALGVGMLVDNSIVVLESITRCREEGLGFREAAVEGTRRVASAVTASTLTTVAVFFPIVFVEGVAGQLFGDQSLTVVYALLMSLLVALFVIPMLATRRPPGPEGADDVGDAPAPRRLLGRAAAAAGRLVSAAASAGVRATAAGGRLALRLVQAMLWPFAAAFDVVYRAVDGAYRPLLRTALRARLLVIAGAAGLLALSLSRVGHLGSELLPEVHQGELYVDCFLRRDATVERTHAVMDGIERAIHALPAVESTFLACGVDPDELNDSDQGPHSARVLVRMRRTDDRLAQDAAVRAAIRDILDADPRILDHRFAQPSVLAFAAPLVVEVLGDDLIALRATCEEVADLLRGVDGLRDVRATLQRGNPELSLHLDREKLAALQLDLPTVIETLKTKVLGQVPTRFTERERKIDMQVGIDRDELDTVRRLLDVNVNPAGTPGIPLSAVARVRRQEGPSEIRRLGNLRGAEVQAALVGLDMGSTQARVEDVLGTIDPPRGVTLRLGGQKEEMQRSFDSLRTAILLAVFLVYVVMASQFESLVQPLVILMSLPLALVGAILALDLLDVRLSVVALLGAIVLAGIVVNNAIILIDQINRLRAQGMAKLEAIVQGAHTRLRPVLMTTMTTVLGLLPLTGWLAGVPVIGGTGEGTELRAPLAVTVIFGLLSSTALTLLVIPCIYSLSDRRR